MNNTGELLDIVDENNVPLGISKPRSVVHAEMKEWHRTTGIWVMNDKKQFLCQQRSLKKDEEPGEWQPHFGGHLIAGETYDQNIINELEQETGIQAKIEDLIVAGIWKSEKKKHFSKLYLYVWNGNISELKLDKEEVEQVKWMSVEEFGKLARQIGYPDYTFNKLILAAIPHIS